MKKMLAGALSGVLALSMLQVSVFADDVQVSGNTQISIADCTVIGNHEDFECDIYYYDIADGSTSVELVDLADKMEEGTVCGLLQTGYAEGYVIDLNDDFSLTYDQLVDGYGDSLDLDACQGLDFSNIYGLFAYDDNYDAYIYIIQADEATQVTADEPEEEESFTISAFGKELSDIEKTEEAYSYINWGDTEPTLVSLYTVVVPRDTKEVKINFEKDTLAYNYDSKGNYLAGAVEDPEIGSYGGTYKVDANEDGIMDYLQVQNPYVENNGIWTGGEIRYAITFVEDTFTAYADQAELTEISSTEDGYSYINWGDTDATYVTLYTINIPAGTEEVALDFSLESLAYNYDANGNYLAGAVKDPEIGSYGGTYKVDANKDGILDYIQVQNPYVENNGIWTGGEIRYALTFHEVPDVDSVTLSAARYNYNGKVHKPSVKILTKDGNALSKSYYSLTYSNKESKLPGRYKVTVRFKGIYSSLGSKTLSYCIKPAATKNLKFTSVKNTSAKISYAKCSGVSGYEIVYSTSSSFKNAKTITTTLTGKTIKNLKSGKKYYVRVRAFKNVTVKGQKVRVYSAWSSKTNVTTK